MAEQNRPPNPFLRDRNREELDHYVIYERPKDFPDKFVVRKWSIVDGEEKAIPMADKNLFVTADTLEEARGFVPKDRYRIPRAQEDEPQIVETWI